MTSTPPSTLRTSDFLILPVFEWPEYSDLPLEIDYPIIEEDTVEIDLQGF